MNYQPSNCQTVLSFFSRFSYSTGSIREVRLHLPPPKPSRVVNLHNIYCSTHVLTSFLHCVFLISIFLSFSLISGLIAAGSLKSEDTGLQSKAPADTETGVCGVLLMLHRRIWLSVPAKASRGRFICSPIVANTFLPAKKLPGQRREPWKRRN